MLLYVAVLICIFVLLLRNKGNTHGRHNIPTPICTLVLFHIHFLYRHLSKSVTTSIRYYNGCLFIKKNYMESYLNVYQRSTSIDGQMWTHWWTSRRTDNLVKDIRSCSQRVKHISRYDDAFIIHVLDTPGRDQCYAY